jgi:predicted MFS family arabinose efflux permease
MALDAPDPLGPARPRSAERTAADGAKGPVASAGAQPARRPSVFSIPEFRWLYAGNVAFFAAMGSQGVVRQALAHDLTDSKLGLGLLGTLSALPMALLAPLGGGLADRADRRKVILGGQVAVGLAEAVVLGLLLAGVLRFPHLLALSCVMGGVFPFVMPARQAIVANLVGRDRLPQAMALTITGINTARVVGPVLGGVLAEQLGRGWAYAIGTALYGVAVACTFRIRASRPATDPGVSLRQSVVEGARYLRGQPLVLTLIAFGLVPLLLAMPVQSFFVAFAEEIWHRGESGLSALAAAVGIGGILGSGLVVWLRDSHGRARRQMIAVGVFACALAGFALAGDFWVGVALLLVAMAAASVFQTLNNTAIHVLIPDRVRGRVSSFLLMSMSLPMLGGAPLGIAADHFGLRATFAAAAGLSVAIAAAFYLGSARLRRLEASVREALLATTD